MFLLPFVFAVVAQTTLQSDLPVTAGAVQPRFGGGTCYSIGSHVTSSAPCPDIYIAKYDGDKLVAATYLGGTGPEFSTAVYEEPDGSVVVLG